MDFNLWCKKNQFFHGLKYQYQLLLFLKNTIKKDLIITRLLKSNKWPQILRVLWWLIIIKKLHLKGKR